jgi:hypothetical protein
MPAWQRFNNLRLRLLSIKTRRELKANSMMTEPSKQSAMRRVVGLDAHPDSFAAAVLEGADADSARVLRTTTRQPLPTLEACMRKHTAPKEVVVLTISADTLLTINS